MYNTRSSIPQTGRQRKPNTPLDIKYLQQRKQWVVWKTDEEGKKPPYNPRTGNYANTINPKTWGTYQEATQAYSKGGYNGIGFVFTKQDPFCGIDLDHCRDPETGVVAAWAQAIVTTISSYTEISPSGQGLHIFIQGTLPGPLHKNKEGTIELYDSERYFTFSGNQLPDTPSTIEDRQAALTRLYTDLFPGPTIKHSGGVRPRPVGASRQAGQIIPLDLSDEELLEQARRGKNGAVFSRMFDDGAIPYTTKGKPDPSKADLALCGILAFYTRGDGARIDRLFRRSALMRPKWDERRGKQTYGERTIALAMRNRGGDYTPEGGGGRQPKRQARYITHAPPPVSAKKAESQEERKARLDRLGETIKGKAQAHLDHEKSSMLVILAPPGVGKSHKVAELGEQTTTYPDGKYNLAWISERRESVVPALSYYYAVQPCTKANCSYHALHTTVAMKGYNTWSIHANHNTPCDYSLQFRKPGSKRYQLAHVKTRYPTQHAGIVIDELDLSKWLPEREIGIHALHSALVATTPGSTAEYLLVSLQAVITEAQRAKHPLHGKALFDALNKRCNNRLDSMLVELRNTKQYEHTHPWACVDIDDPEAEETANHLPPVILPHILAALDTDLFKWRSGTEWNSLIRVGPGRHTWSLFLTEPLAFHSGAHSLPPRIVLDATADEELLRLLFGNHIALHKEHIPPPPGTKHIAIRTGKRYGKRSLCTKRKDGSQPDLRRAIAECKFFLRQVDPDGEAVKSGKVGLITFAQCEQEMREVLGIPEGKSGHFWAMRGSNSLETCEILLVVGTPTLRPAETARLARALWKDDSAPIDETSMRDPDTGTWAYQDPRMQKLAEYMTRAELTQCAHRVRPLKHLNRTVFTFCIGDIDYLSPTQTYTDLPQLTPEGEDRAKQREEEAEAKLASAWDTLLSQGKDITVRALKEASHVATDTAAAYLRKRAFARSEGIQTRQEEPKPGDITTPPLCSIPEPVPTGAIETSYSACGNDGRPPGSPPLVAIPVCRFCGGRSWKPGAGGKFLCRTCFVGPPLRGYEARYLTSLLQSV